jgi:hypothetical protein
VQVQELEYRATRGGKGRGSEAYSPARANSAAQKAGLSFEAKVQAALCSRFGAAYHPAPNVLFRDDSGARLCVPDGILGRPVSDPLVIVVEIKVQHMPEAWWQLRELYQPVLETIYRDVALLEICKVYDPHTPFPEPVRFHASIDEFLATARRGDLGVIRWK